MSQLITSHFLIKGMDCSACAVNIDLDLEEITGIKNSKTNYAKQVTTVTYDHKLTNIESIKAVISRYGYQVELIEKSDP